MTYLTGNSFGMRQFQTNASTTPPQDPVVDSIRRMTPDQALKAYFQGHETLEAAYHSIGNLIQAGADVPEQQPQLAIRIQQLEQQTDRLEKVQGYIAQTHPEAFMQPQVWQS